MAEKGYDLSTHPSKPLEPFNGTHVTVAVTMGRGDYCPLVNADRREDWTSRTRRNCLTTASARCET
jgi:protein-tyrosine-phosphatase